MRQVFHHGQAVAGSRETVWGSNHRPSVSVPTGSEARRQAFSPGTPVFSPPSLV